MKWIGPTVLGGLALLLATARRRGAGALPMPPQAYVSTGCEGDVAPIAKQPPPVQQAYREAWAYVRMLQRLVGPGELRGWHRPPDCNRRRDGAPRSRHQGGGAVDVRLTPQQARRLVALLRETGAIDGSRRALYRQTPNGRRSTWGDRVRAATRLAPHRGIGLRIYTTGTVHMDVGCPDGVSVCDPRTDDWIEVLYAA